MNQDIALEILKTGASVFLTGGAGTGKTFVLNKYIQFLKQSGIPYAVTASTGISATHLGGITINSWSGIGIKKEINEYDIEQIESKQYLYKRISKTEVLIIDEVSMLHSNILDSLDKILSSIKRSDKPFGGIQIVFSGDLFQLPPVIKNQEVALNDFMFMSNSYRKLDPVVCYLKDQYRQTEGDLNFILDSIRKQDISDEIYTLLQDRSKIKHEDFYTRLYTHNIDVDEENNKELSLINEDEKVYAMDSHGKENLVLNLKKSCLAPEVLTLKKGARVMFVKNSPELGFMNGTIGEVVYFSKENYPVVLLSSGREITVKRADWSIEEDGKIKATITQIPIRLAWAITIHKSQGMSLDRAEIDLSKAFTYGQGYVALSRLKNIEGLSLISGLSNKALLLHPDLLLFDKSLQELSNLTFKAFSSFNQDEIKERQKNFVLRVQGTWVENLEDFNLDYHGKDLSSTYEKTKLLLENSDDFYEVSKSRNLTLGTILKHCEVLKESGDLPNLKKFNLINEDRLEIILNTFKQLKTDKMTPIIEYLNKADFETSYEEVRVARLFL
jgi:hypothetical protein